MYFTLVHALTLLLHLPFFLTSLHNPLLSKDHSKTKTLNRAPHYSKSFGMYRDLTRNGTSSLPPFASPFAAQWQSACEAFEAMLCTEDGASNRIEQEAMADANEKRIKNGRRVPRQATTLRSASSSAVFTASNSKKETRQEEAERLARQRVRIDALHAEMDEWITKEAEARREEDTAKAKDKNSIQRKISIEGNGPPTAPHSPLATSASLQPTTEGPGPKQPSTPPHVAFLPPSAIPLAESTAEQLSEPPSLQVLIDGLDASLKAQLPWQLVTYFDQADERFGLGDFAGALTLLQGLERKLALGESKAEGSEVGIKAGEIRRPQPPTPKLGMLGLATRYLGKPSASNLPLPTSLLTNMALCSYKMRDFRTSLRMMQAMIGTPSGAEGMAVGGGISQTVLDPSRATATGLTIAVRSALLLVDVRSAKAATSSLRRLMQTEAKGNIGGHGTAALDASIRQYTLVARDLEQYRECLNQKLYVSALDHITAACGNCFHDIALELIRVECLVHVRPREADEDIRALLEVFPNEPQLWVWRAVLQITEQEPIESLTIASQHLLRALSLDGNNAKGRGLLRAIRIINGKLHTAEQHQKDKKWQEGLAEYQSILDGSALRHQQPDGDAAAAVSRKASVGGSFKRPSSAAADVVAAPARVEDTQVWNEVREIMAQAAVMSSVRVEALCCLLKGGDPKAVINECSTILGYHQYAAGGPSSTSTVSPLYVYRAQLASPKTYRIRPAILKSFRAQAYVAIKDFAKALGDAKDVYKEAPSAGSKEFIEYIETQGNLGGHRREDGRGQQRSSSAAPMKSVAAEQKANLAMLGLSPGSSSAEVTKAYKVAALKWHPDKWVGGTDTERAAAEEHFKKLNQAYTSLQEAKL